MFGLEFPRDLICAAASWRKRAGAFVARRVRLACSRRALWVTAPLLALLLLLLLPGVGLVYHIYFDRRGLPDLEPFIRFELSTIGQVYDARGTVLVELAREYRRVVSYDEVPAVLRHAILAAEDKNFFSHSGVEYRALPRVVYKTAVHSLAAWWKGGIDFRLRFPQGGSTLTQQLVRGYFLRDRSSRENGAALFRNTATSWVLSAALGVPTTNKLLRKMEEMRLALWLEEEMRRRYGSREQAKREIFARSASFNYLGNGRYGFATGSEYYFGKPLSSYTEQDAGKAALLAGITKAPRDYAPVADDPRPLRRRNEILALMARNGYIAESLAKRSQAEPVLLVGRHEPPGQDPRARRDRHRHRRAEAARRGPLRDRGPLPGADRGSLHGGRAGADHRERSPGERPRPLREAVSRDERADPGLGRGAAQRGRGDPGRGGWAAGLQGPATRATPTTTARPVRCDSRARPGSLWCTWPRSART